MTVESATEAAGRSWFRSMSQQVRAGEWVASKLPELAVATTAMICGSGRWPGPALFAAFLGSAALLAYGYAWNDRCDWAADRLAGKPQRGARPSASLCAGLASAFLALSVGAGGGRLPTAAAAVGTLGFAWSYSARPIRWKERGRLGLIVGSGAQRVLPLVVVATVVAPRWAALAAGIVWLELWGVRAMVVHQVLDASSDRRSGVRTWATDRDPVANGLRLFRATVPVELGAFVAMVGLVAPNPVLAVVAVLVGGLAVGRIIRARILGYGGEVGWLSFDYQPLSATYIISGPVVLGVVLVAGFGAVSTWWLGLAALVSVAPAALLLDHLVDRPEVGGTA